MMQRLTILLVCSFPVLFGCSPEDSSTRLTVDESIQLREVDREGLAAILKSYRGKGVLVSVWSSD